MGRGTASAGQRPDSRVDAGGRMGIAGVGRCRDSCGTPGRKGDIMLDSAKIGNFIAARRKNLGLTQQQLADKLSVSFQAVSKWENGHSVPDVPMLCALADYFEVTTDELLGRNRRGKILICDDAPLIRHVVCDMLNKRKYPCEAVENGGQLYEKLDELRQPCKVFLDVHLGNSENGLDILKKIKEKYREVKVIMLTADTSEETTSMIKEYKADYLIHKPFHDGLIFKALSEIEGNVNI